MDLSELIVYKYTELLLEYLQHMNRSEFLRTLPNSSYIICIGINTLLHIFKIIFHKTQNIDTTYYHCQKASYCYLEYIEQMNKTFSLHNLNNQDAVMFVYKNSLMDIPPLHKSMDVETVHVILTSLSCITKKLIFFSDEWEWETEEPSGNISFTLEQMEFLIKHFMKRFFLLTFPHDKSYLFSFIQNVKKSLSLDYPEYCEWLKQVYRILKKKGNIPTESELNEKYILHFVNPENRNILIQWKTEKKMEEITKILF